MRLSFERGQNGFTSTETLSLTGAATVISASGTSDASWALPPVLRDKVPARLRVLSAIYALAALSFEGITHFGPEGVGWSFDRWCLVSGTIFVGSLTVWLFATWARVSPQVLHRVGLVFQVVVCALAASWEVTAAIEQARVSLVFDPTWVSFMILAFPLFYPAPPAQAMAVTLVSISTVPIAFVVAGKSIYGGLPPFTLLWALSGPTVLAGAIGWTAGWMIVRLGKQLSDAREMGSYRLIERLGVGGMGEVWKAEHHMLARSAAIKLIRADFLESSGAAEQAASLARFGHEAQVTASLTSPHTVELYDFGMTEDGRLYYVMELLDGINLDVIVRQYGPLPPSRVIYLLRQACDSLADAHGRHLIHRDIKPANLISCCRGRQYDVLKVLDFGLASLGPTEADGSRPAQEQGVIHGTPSYIAPETVRGETPDGRADLYSLACTGYWLLSGMTVFTGDSVAELLSHHLHTEVTPPSRLTEQPVPGDLESILLRCLAKDPEARPEGAESL